MESRNSNRFSSQMNKRKWLGNLVPCPVCFQCDEEFETFHHLVQDCEILRALRHDLQIQN